MFIATINVYKGANASVDKNGNQPLILNVLAGKCPSKRMISQGWANTQGMEIGKTYLIEDIELEVHAVYGRQFQFNKIQEVSCVDIVEFSAKYPKNIYPVEATVSQVKESEVSVFSK